MESNNTPALNPTTQTQNQTQSAGNKEKKLIS
jgi:hypothetical protein